MLAPFQSLITPQILKEMRKLVPIAANSYTYQPSDFANGSFPFGAYSEENEVNGIIYVKKEEDNG